MPRRSILRRAPPYFGAHTSRVIPIVARTSWVDTYRDEAEADVRAAVAELDDIRATAEAVVGDPLVELSKLARAVDLLVVGSRGWGPLRRVLLGNTAAALTHEAHCPLIVLPRGAAPAQTEPRPTDVAAPAAVC